jgi:hypothetical protein
LTAGRNVSATMATGRGPSAGSSARRSGVDVRSVRAVALRASLAA